MGLFDELKTVAKKNVDKKIDGAISSIASTKVGKTALNVKAGYETMTGKHEQPTTIIPWKCAPYRATVRLPEDVDGTVYTYYSEPLRGITIGERFDIEAVPGDTVLHSSYSGNRLDTAESRMIAYMYKGQIFGASTCCYRTVRELAESGCKVICTAEKVGMYDKDIPKIVIHTSFKDENCTVLHTRR